jgi:hypothetical protein
MQVAFQLMHTQDNPNRQSRLRIGLYKTTAQARDAIAQLENLPGFRDPDGSFILHECIIDHDYIPHGLDTQSAIASLTDQNFPPVAVDKLFFVYNEPRASARHPGDTAFLIGYYSTEDRAKSAIERIRQLAIYPEHNREFNYCSTTLNQTDWTSGYTTIEEVMKQYR